jgi:methylated-DNA-[protein]-cysteine S-methyltransferase
MTRTFFQFDSALGVITLVQEGDALVGLCMADHRHVDRADGEPQATALALRAQSQIEEYLAGERTEFDLPITLHGTEFQKKVWWKLLEIPYGDRISYAALAARIGDIKATRAVGLANGRNPLAIIVPCHRVVGADGKLTGYGGGIERKAKLLDLERGLLRF